MKKIIIICGPTGVGKTKTAIRLAETFKGEIISADSMQIYKLMNIGTAKPALNELNRIKHHLMDFLLPDASFDAAKFEFSAGNIISDLTSNNILPFVTGGTGLYIKALIYGLSKKQGADPDKLEQLKKKAEEIGSKKMHKLLENIDPVSAKKIHENDLFRIIRAIETFETAKIPLSELHKSHCFKKPHYNTLKIGLILDREKLYKRINQRVDKMVKQNFVCEVKNLLDMGYKSDLKSMKSLGYRQICEFIEGQTGFEQSIENIKRDTRRYAKRQITWFKADKEIKWIQPDKTKEITEIISNFLSTNMP